MASTGQIITFKELDDAANRLSQVLRNAGLNPGDHVAFCIENHPRYFEILWGCHYAGLIYTACSSRLTTDELNYIINDCGAKAFITSKHKADQAAEVANTTKAIEVDVAEAVLAMYTLESACRIQILAQSGGGELTRIPQDIIADAVNQSRQVTKGKGAGLAWPGLLRRLDRIDPSYKD